MIMYIHYTFSYNQNVHNKIYIHIDNTCTLLYSIQARQSKATYLFNQLNVEIKNESFYSFIYICT